MEDVSHRARPRATPSQGAFVDRAGGPEPHQVEHRREILECHDDGVLNPSAGRSPGASMPVGCSYSNTGTETGNLAELIEVLGKVEPLERRPMKKTRSRFCGERHAPMRIAPARQVPIEAVALRK